ncbi:MAG: nitroreductase family protein [Eubacteriales bacterium]|nr:nitroreductase family protein [Eubacteriales bacterium]
MNTVLESLYTRKSVRAYTRDPIPEDVKMNILLAASNAPTAGNQQLYTVLTITDPALKTRLSETCDHQPFIAEAPLVLIFCADTLKWYDAYAACGCSPRAPGPGDLMLAVSDAMIAAQNAVTAAWSMGVGSCYIGDIMENCEEHRSLLGLPPQVFPAAMLVFGYPTAQQLNRPKPERAPLAGIVQENRYCRRDGDATARMLAGDTAKPYREWMQAFCKRKYHSDFASEMNRSVGTYLQAFLPEAEESPQPLECE